MDTCALKNTENLLIEKTKFRVFPNAVIDFVVKSDLSAAAIKLYLYIYKNCYSDNEYSIEKSYKFLADAINSVTKTVQRALKELLRIGLIAREPSEAKTSTTYIRYPDPLISNSPPEKKQKTIKPIKPIEVRQMTTPMINPARKPELYNLILVEKLDEIYKSYNLNQSEKILVTNEVKACALKFEWDRSIILNVTKEVCWAATYGAFSKYANDKLTSLKKAFVVMSDGRWKTPDHFDKEFKRQTEQYEQQKRRDLCAALPRDVLAKMQGIGRKGMDPASNYSGYDC